MTDGEFDFIAKYLRPLTENHPAALGLADDAALFEAPAGMQLVLAKDALVEDVHFFAHDPAGQIAQKLLRVNLSDLAAMGATPRAYLLALIRSQSTPVEWLGRFAGGLAEDQAAFGLALLGGDTVATPGPLSFSVTMLGEVPRGQALRRNGARPGDDVYVSGTLGDGALGLSVLRGRVSPSMSASKFLIDRYRLPRPRVDLGVALRGLAHAAIDISDGLVADLAHVLRASDVGAEIWTDRLPVSRAAASLQGAMEAALTGGDDYELLFTAHPEQRPAIDAIGQRLGLALSVIGRIEKRRDLSILDADGQAVPLNSTGWQHF